MTLSVIFYPYHFVHTILSNTILSVYHFVHTILSVPFCPPPFCSRTTFGVCIMSYAYGPRISSTPCCKFDYPSLRDRLPVSYHHGVHRKRLLIERKPICTEVGQKLVNRSRPLAGH